MTAKPKDPRVTLRRGEAYQVQQLISARIDRHTDTTCSYKLGESDETVAVLAAKMVDRPVDAALVARVRMQTFGKLPTEGRPTPELLTHVLRRVDNLATALKAATDRIAALERDLYEDERAPEKPNGHHRTA